MSQQHFFHRYGLPRLNSIGLLAMLLSSSTLLWSMPNATHLTRSTFETTLSNGLKVIIREDQRAPIVMTQIWYAVGSADESGNHLGVSHALEHMMFKGTQKVPDNEFTLLSQRFGGKINAATSSNYTQYYQLYPKQYFPLALELEADRMQNLVLRQEDFATELKVVIEERRQRTEDNLRNLAFERFKWITYPTSHYRQPVIGYMKSLNNLQLNDLKNWYKTWYAPNNATLIIVGDVNAEQALSQVKKYFAAIPKQTLPERNDVLEFDRVGYRHMELQLSTQVPNLYMAWNVRSLATSKNPSDAYALNIIQSILGKDLSARLQARLIRQQKVLSAVHVDYQPYNRGDSVFMITAVPAANVKLEQAQQAIEQQIKVLQNELIEAHELQRIKTNFVANLIYSQDDIAEQARMLGQLEVNGLSYRLIDELSQHYDQVTAQEIKRVANLYLVRDNLSTLYIIPQAADR
ncbi:peptidase M16 [Acinetobacter larvae]|uniref:Peptidase M16 n=2 Tax=Acinetobacter larvae TaxID=1789224 RepID=A0A1B2M427_9GAMM|nr:peptidase M16 [Acinetobacter larvae]